MINNLPTDISVEIFGERILSVLKSHGFGVLGKADLEAALLHATIHSSKSFGAADSFRRAEMLRITDQKYRTLSRRAGIWLGEDLAEISDDALFSEFLSKAIRLYVQSPDEKEVRVVIDDELQRRNVQRALERAAISGLSIAVEISLTGRSLILRGSDLDRMIGRLGSDQRIASGLKQVIQDKQGVERRRAALGFLKKNSGKVFDGVIAAMVTTAMRI